MQYGEKRGLTDTDHKKEKLRVFQRELLFVELEFPQPFCRTDQCRSPHLHVNPDIVQRFDGRLQRMVLPGTCKMILEFQLVVCGASRALTNE